MQVREEEDWCGKPGFAKSISNAIDYKLSSNHYDGKLEQVHEVANSTAEMMGRLVEMLHQKGALNDENVLALLGHGWEIAS